MRTAAVVFRALRMLWVVALLAIGGTQLVPTQHPGTLASAGGGVATEAAPTQAIPIVGAFPLAATITPTTLPVRPAYLFPSATVSLATPATPAGGGAALRTRVPPLPTFPAVAVTPTSAPLVPTLEPTAAVSSPTALVPEPTAEPTASPQATVPPWLAGCTTGQAPRNAFAQRKRVLAATPSPALPATRPGSPVVRAPAVGTPTTRPVPAPTPESTPTATPTTTPTPSAPPALEQEVDALLAQYAPGALDAGLVIAIAGAETPVRVNADRQFATASLYKLFVLWRLQVAIATGELSEGQQLVFCPDDDDVAEDGTTFGAYGDTFSVAELRRLMIVRSNNTATWILAHRLGWGEIDRMLAAAGFTKSSASDGRSTPDEIARFYRGLLAQNLDPRLAAPDYAPMLDLLRAQEINHLLPVGLPPGTDFAHKTGNLPGVLNDAGVIFLPDGRTILIVAMTRGDEGACQDILQALGALVWHHATR